MSLTKEEALAVAAYLESLEGYGGRLLCFIKPLKWWAWNRIWRVLVKGVPLAPLEREGVIAHARTFFKDAFKQDVSEGDIIFGVPEYPEGAKWFLGPRYIVEDYYRELLMNIHRNKLIEKGFLRKDIKDVVKESLKKK